MPSLEILLALFGPAALALVGLGYLVHRYVVRSSCVVTREPPYVANQESQEDSLPILVSLPK